MDHFRHIDLKTLTEAHTVPCATLYMPTRSSGADDLQDAIRLKNLADQAELMLADGWMRPPEARDLVAPLYQLPSDRAFWSERSAGLAIFLNREMLKTFRVPISLEELVLVNRRFYLKGLLPLLSGADRFFILTLSQHSVRLFEATQFHADQLDVEGLPQNIEQALHLDDARRWSQSHSATTAGSGRQHSVFHGQASVSDSHKEELTQFFRMVDSALVPVLRNETVPLVLAGVEYLLPIFRKTCRYAHLTSTALTGNCDHLSADQLREKAWPLVEPSLTAGRRHSAAKYQRLAGTDKATDDIQLALTAAFEGRIDCLFVANDQHIWGNSVDHGRVLEINPLQQPGDEDLLDVAAVRTLLCGGHVHVVNSREMPCRKPLAAVLRF
ncbi:MAG: hypothetical protein KDA81_19675 [Planctomycetaceae bacterium]|nr:hypothetical protein [Planctomycetaceae bacterium]